MQYALYKSQFEANRAALQVPPDCLVGEPEFRISTPNSWDLKWLLTFDDRHYIRCREIWSHRTGRPARRHAFTFHYGPIVTVDANGAIQFRHTDSVHLRIDMKHGEPPHLHYRAPEPHYMQDRIEGFVIAETLMFPFIEAVFKSRGEGLALHTILGFRTL